MRGLLCIAFLIGWPVFMWFFATSIVSFARWDNYFVVGFGQWHDLSRVMFMMLWFAGVVVFIECSSSNKVESK
jgi:hypothetical protein